MALAWVALGLTSVSAILYGVRRHRPARVGPWLLLAASISASATGDVCYALGVRPVADLFYYAMFVLVACSLLQLTRGGALLVDRARLIDLLAFVCATLLVVWVFIIGGDGRFGSVTGAYVIGALLLVTVAARLLAAARRNSSAVLLLIGAVGVLASDIAQPLAPGLLSETGYMVLYAAWGAAGLHPSMVRLTAPAPARLTPWRVHWAALLGISVATPPIVLLIEALSGTVRDGVVIAVAGAITLLLTITRLTDSVALSNQTLARERALREATAALVAAADIPAVDSAVRAAVGALMRPHAVHTIVFAVDDRALAREALPPATESPGSRSWWIDGTGGDEATLVCPLWLEPLSVARPSGGALVLTGRHDDLAAGRDALEVVAGQAALALDRITLVQAVGRRDSDLYLRAVIRNTADIMLVIDDDQRVRYASPALRGLLGRDDLPPLTTLHDLVHPDDRIQVRQALQNDGDGVFFCAMQCSDDRQILVEATYRDLRADRLVQGFVVTMRDVTPHQDSDERLPHREHVDELPAWVNRRSAQHKFRY